MPMIQKGQAAMPVNEAVADGALTAAPASSANGTALSGRPEGATGVIVYLPTGTSLTYTIATSQPGSPPALTTTITEADKAVYEPLGPDTNLYVTAKTGTVLYRWI